MGKIVEFPKEKSKLFHSHVKNMDELRLSKQEAMKYLKMYMPEQLRYQTLQEYKKLLSQILVREIMYIIWDYPEQIKIVERRNPGKLHGLTWEYSRPNLIVISTEEKLKTPEHIFKHGLLAALADGNAKLEVTEKGELPERIKMRLKIMVDKGNGIWEAE